MPPTSDEDRDTFKKVSTGTKPWNLFQLAAKGFINAQVQDLDKEVAYVYGLVLMEVRVTRREDGWRVMLKGMRDNVHYVAFSSADYFGDAFEFALYEVRNGQISFKPDKYPVRL